MTRLSVNVNKVATIRNTRTLGIPSVVRMSRICLEAGAHGITVHPRPDQRHIRPGDVADVAELLKKHPEAEFNIEGNPFIEFMPYIERYRPTQATLVPDSPEAFTSDHGWQLDDPSVVQKLGPVVDQIRALGVRVSLFLDARSELLPAVVSLGADRIELYTEPYAAAFAAGDPNAVAPYAAAAKLAGELGLEVNAGHDLNLQNLPVLIQHAPSIAEVSIGHALMADALEFGLAETVRRYLAACCG